MTPLAGEMGVTGYMGRPAMTLSEGEHDGYLDGKDHNDYLGGRQRPPARGHDNDRLFGGAGNDLLRGAVEKLFAKAPTIWTAGPGMTPCTAARMTMRWTATLATTSWLAPPGPPGCMGTPGTTAWTGGRASIR